MELTQPFPTRFTALNGLPAAAAFALDLSMRLGVAVGRALAALLIAVYVAGPLPALSEQVLVLNNATDPPLTNEGGTGFLDVIAREVFKRADLGLELIKLPPERGLKNANDGIDDGELIRIAGLETAYPNLVRVPEKIFDMEFVAFTKDAQIRAEDWRGLKPYSVGFIKGWKIFENNVPAGTSVILARGPEQLFTMLERDRVDIVLYSRIMGLSIVRRLHMNGVRDLAPPLETREMFIYLHRKHSHLVPRIAQALADVKAEGLYEKLYQKISAPLAAGQ